MPNESIGGLELLLSAGASVERIHQCVWHALLKHSAFLAELELPSSYGRQVDREPDAGIFDLKAATDDGPVWIELKVDSDLGKAQLHRQYAHARAKGGRVVHALLGFADIRARPRLLPMIEENRGILLDGARVITALRRVQESSEASAAARQLARAYAGQLEVLGQRGADFLTTRSWSRDHSLCFFERLRRECPDMKEAAIAYVANPAGGFDACYWGGADGGGGVQCYLQWEHRKLCFKISVADRAKYRSARTAALEFLRGKRLGNTEICRPTHLGSGQTMTVGFVKELSVGEGGGTWAAMVGAMTDATRVSEQMAECLRASG